MFARALIVLLLVANVGVAAWWALRAPPAPPAAAALPPGVPRLQLLAEAPVRARATPAPAPATSLPPAARCLAFGPFADATALAKARTALQPRVARLQARSVAAPRGWRVWLPPLPDRAAAQATAQRIAAAGFSDYYVVVDGGEANGIALGRYGSEAAARERARTLQAAGFAAQAEPLPGSGAQWLDAAVAADFDAAAARTSSGAQEARTIACAGLH